MKNNNNKLTTDDIFTQDWYEKVVAATNLVLKNNNTLMDNMNLALYVIDYNVNKILQEKILEYTVKNLPKSLDWKHKDIIDMFGELKDIIDSCNLCPNFEKHNITINMSSSNNALSQVILWKDLINEHYSNLNLNLTPFKTKNKYKLEITRIK